MGAFFWFQLKRTSRDHEMNGRISREHQKKIVTKKDLKDKQAPMHVATQRSESAVPKTRGVEMHSNTHVANT